MADIVKWILVGWTALGVLLTVAMVGKPREPISPAVAVVSTIFSVAVIVLMVVFWPAS